MTASALFVLLLRCYLHAETHSPECFGDYAAEKYAYLAEAAAEVVSARAVLANSYIAAYAMPWTDRKRCSLIDILPRLPHDDGQDRSYSASASTGEERD